MASGFGSVDNFQDTIQATVDNAIDFARAQLEIKESVYCVECDELIPLKRRQAIKTNCCIKCQEIKDKKIPQLYNRRGSKDSQLR